MRFASFLSVALASIGVPTAGESEPVPPIPHPDDDGRIYVSGRVRRGMRGRGGRLDRSATRDDVRSAGLVFAPTIERCAYRHKPRGHARVCQACGAEIPAR